MIAKANGSAYFEREKIKIICAVHGPRQQGRSAPYSPDANVTCEVKYAPFACRSRHGYVRDAHERALSAQLADALAPSILTHKYPKSEIAIYITILEEDGALATLAAALSAASCAVADAGIECADLVAAASVTLRSEGEVLVDTSAEEGQVDDVGMVVGYMANRGEVTLMQMTGLVAEYGKIDTLLDVCVQQASLVRAIVNKTLNEQ